MLRDPGHWPDALVNALVPTIMRPSAFHGFIGVRLPGESNDFCASGKRRGNEESKRPFGYEAVFEAHTPLVRPKFHVPDFPGDKCLAVAVAGEHVFALIHDAVVEIGVSADRKAINGRVSDAFLGLRPIARHTVMARLVIEEGVKAARHDHVEIEIEHLARNTLKLLLPKRDFSPGKPAAVLRKIDMRKGVCFDCGVDPL